MGKSGHPHIFLVSPSDVNGSPKVVIFSNLPCPEDADTSLRFFQTDTWVCDLETSYLRELAEHWGSVLLVQECPRMGISRINSGGGNFLPTEEVGRFWSWGGVAIQLPGQFWAGSQSCPWELSLTRFLQIFQWSCELSNLPWHISSASVAVVCN